MAESTESSLGKLIALDWGTSSFRAYLLDGDGEIIDSFCGEDGILSSAKNFEAVFKRYTGNWLDRKPDLPIIASGMIGSRQGWVEVPYIELPIGLNELAAGLKTYTTSEGVSIRFVPGVSSTETVLPDVMRGEETQVFGALDSQEDKSLFVLPGTHSKWVRVEKGKLIDFRTFMTGELFQALRLNTILGRLMHDDIHDSDSFIQGVLQIHSDSANCENLMSTLFSVRTLGLFERIAPPFLASYLSGLLIGAEIRAAQDLGFHNDSLEPILVGSSELVSRYSLAFTTLGFQSRLGHQQAAARGIFSIENHSKVKNAKI